MNTEKLYSAFMSYSHATDARLAPALQRALHRFAKPWYRVRALRVFRDQTNLSASPGLWSSIEAALEQSQWLLLMASPEAARSKWVNREVSWWLSHRSAETILLILTDGELLWNPDAGEFEACDLSAAPPAFRGALRQEPLFVDARWARNVDRLSIGDPRFRATTLDIAATLHGRSKQELDGEDVRAHRLTRRLATIAVMAILVFAAVATWQWRAAVHQRVLAESRQREAERQKTRAVAHMLTSESRVRSIERNHDRALLLAVEGARMSPSVATHSAVLDALQQPQMPRTFLWGHEDTPSAVSFNRDGTLLATGDWGGNILLWKSGRRIAKLPREHTGEIRELAFDSNTDVLASGSEDHTVILWDLAKSGSLSTRLTGHVEPVTAVAFSPDQRFVVSADESGSIVFWDRATGMRSGRQIQKQAEPVTSVAFSPNGRLLATGDFGDRVTLWDVKTRRRMGKPFNGHETVVTSVAFAPDGTSLASADAHGAIRIWTIGGSRTAGRALGEHGGEVTKLAFLPKGDAMLSSGYDGRVRLWELRTGRARTVGVHRDRALDVALSPDGHTVASVGRDRRTILWDLWSPNPLATTTLCATWVEAVAFSPDGSLLACAGTTDEGIGAGGRHELRGTIRILNAKSHEYIGPPLDAHGKNVQAVAFDPNGRHLASAAQKTLVLWDVSQRPPTQIGRPLEGHVGDVLAARFTRDGSRLVSGDNAGQIVVWDPVLGKAVGGPIGSSTKVVRALAAHPNGQMIFGGVGPDIVRWESPGKILKVSPVDHAIGLTSLAISPDASRLASGGFDYNVILRDPATGERIGEALTGHHGFVYSVAFSPDGSLLASADDAGVVILWDTRTRRPTGASLRGHDGSVRTLAFSPDGQTLVSGGHDGAVVFWNVDAAEWSRRACEVAGRNLTHDEWLRFVPDEQYHEICPGRGAPRDQDL
jgi:WD40 repeat protein